MSPLTHEPVPPGPLKATHVAEVQRASDRYGQTVKETVDRWVRFISFPRVRWLLAIGVSVGNHTVSASVGNQPYSGRTGTGTNYSAQQVKGKSWWLVEINDGRLPVSATRYSNYCQRIRTRPNNLPRPVQPVMPVVPPKPNEYEEYVRRWGTAGAQLLWYYLRSELKRLLLDVGTFWAWGTVSGVDVSNKSATVVLEATSADDASRQQVVCGWGTRTWTASSLNGKRVRVGMNSEAVWVDDIDSGRVRSG
jgi:hypothetical protein